MTAKTLSTWSLHRTLGCPSPREDTGVGVPADEGGLPLLELPAELAAHGYDALQLVHFHLPSRDPGYLAELRAEIASRHLLLDTFLLDGGDATAPGDEDLDWMSAWLDDAEALGATRARVIAGRSAPEPATIARSADRLRRLASAHPALRIVTENWLEMTPDASSTLAVLDAAGPEVGLLVDLANWTGPAVLEELARIGGRAETCHAKARLGTRDDAAGESAFVAALESIRGAGFDGSLALVYDGPDGADWSMLEREWTLVQQVFG